MDSTIYFEVLVLGDILLGDVFCDDIIGHITGTAAEGEFSASVHEVFRR